MFWSDEFLVVRLGFVWVGKLVGWSGGLSVFRRLPAIKSELPLWILWNSMYIRVIQVTLDLALIYT